MASNAKSGLILVRFMDFQKSKYKRNTPSNCADHKNNA